MQFRPVSCFLQRRLKKISKVARLMGATNLLHMLKTLKNINFLNVAKTGSKFVMAKTFHSLHEIQVPSNWEVLTEMSTILFFHIHWLILKFWPIGKITCYLDHMIAQFKTLLAGIKTTSTVCFVHDYLLIHKFKGMWSNPALYGSWMRN